MYKHKDLYILDFSKYKTAADMHEDFKQVFDFPDYYGNNWDALYFEIAINGPAIGTKNQMKIHSFFQHIPPAVLQKSLKPLKSSVPKMPKFLGNA